MTTVAIPLYDGFTALDVVGPYQMLAMTPGVSVRLVAETAGPVRDDRRSLTLYADATFADVRTPDVVVVPGGPGSEHVLSGPLPEWIAAVHPTTTWTTSVCSGSLILAAAGVLTDVPATCHYVHLETLRLFGVETRSERVVEVPGARIITAGGVSSGIDMALRLVELLTDRTMAETIQLWTEYDPQPPFDSGAPHKAAEEVRERAAAYELAARLPAPTA
ncbi:MAG TPA: DJ-1/PfpI family protein [Nocardioides sp.]|nr:DJ-1/PfpI family protein [Nocardioides sp.]